jgi:hypothetical protein
VAEALDLLDGGLELGLTRLSALRGRRRQSPGATPTLEEGNR